ncbi:hypothetical protein IB292_01905 [Vibrio parahaemolyticus]|uniref:Uncharacterized protein n=1 Tax=Vibrio parahaemolyticus TaxID=670 RepID=A0A9Q3UAM5_VIBPH|nr:hypothetical protein [Vibrio parahaemolyticus]MCC3803781.1 hypothetical protein [Vibrio parahaemolyticus]
MLNSFKTPRQMSPELVSKFLDLNLYSGFDMNLFEKVLASYDPTLMVNMSLHTNTAGYSSSFEINGWSGFKDDKAYSNYNELFSRISVPFLNNGELTSEVHLDNLAGVPDSLYGTPSIHIHPDQILLRCSAHQVLPIVIAFAEGLGANLRFIDIHGVSNAVPFGAEVSYFSSNIRSYRDEIYSYLATKRRDKYLLVEHLQFPMLSVFGTDRLNLDKKQQSILRNLDGLYKDLVVQICQSVLVRSLVNDQKEKGFRLVSKSEFKTLPKEERVAALCSSNFLMKHFL